MQKRIHLSPYRIMWLFVMFDLPVGTKKERKLASKFRHDLLDLGFEMSQFSVYLKYCASGDKAKAVCLRIKRIIPLGGKVDILTVTDKQFSGMARFYSGEIEKTEESPCQLRLF